MSSESHSWNFPNYLGFPRSPRQTSGTISWSNFSQIGTEGWREIRCACTTGRASPVEKVAGWRARGGSAYYLDGELRAGR